ncbi:hypothetical protein LX36DRAFT_484858 [Colletotrichum falcatum]|nr:hypothetical protein LX36DRAFT_484858 [Colletotrichum falcatum]
MTLMSVVRGGVGVVGLLRVARGLGTVVGPCRLGLPIVQPIESIEVLSCLPRVSRTGSEKLDSPRPPTPHRFSVFFFLSLGAPAMYNDALQDWGKPWLVPALVASGWMVIMSPSSGPARLAFWAHVSLTREACLSHLVLIPSGEL